LDSISRLRKISEELLRAPALAGSSPYYEIAPRAVVVVEMSENL